VNKPWVITTLAVVALALLAFLNGLGGEFVLDDRAFLVDNPQLLSPHSPIYFFTENLWYYSNIPDAFSASYRPLFFLSLWSSKQLSLASPLALHVFSLMLHVLAALLLLLTIRRLIPGISPLAAGFGAGLFAVHPVHAEAVAWVGAFIHPLATVFLLTAYLAHDRSRNAGGFKSALIALLFFALALLSNEMAITLPFFIVLHDWIRYRNPYFFKNLPYFALLILYLLMRRQVLGEAVPLTFFDPAMWLRLPVFGFEYLRHLVLPWPQPLYLQMPADWSISVAALVTAAFFVALLVWLIRIPAANRRVPLLAIIWIATFLLAPMAAAFSPDARFALRSLYLPSVGIAILISWAVNTLPAFRRPSGKVLLGTILLLALVGTATANRHWKDDGAVYGQIIAWNPTHHAGYSGLGRFHERHGETEQALIQYERSIALAGPKEKTEPLEAMALLLGTSGNNVRSLELFKQLTALNPNSTSAWTGVGNNLWALGQLEAAADAYRQSHQADPDNRIACYNLIFVLNQLGRTDEGARYAECAREAR
jgi:tetratricopeptide (TPR) repeat protein